MMDRMPGVSGESGRLPDAARLLLAGVASVVLAIATASGPARAQSVGDGVLEALEAEGRVRVLVALKPLPEGVQTRAVRRASLEARQSAVLARLAPDDFEVAHRYETLPAVAGTVSGPGLERLLADPDVARVDLDAPGSGELGQSVPQINADLLQQLDGLTGRGVTVAVLDSGMDANHPDLAGSGFGQQCFCSGGGGCCPGGSARRSGLGAARDDHFHGTHVTSIITGDGEVASVGVAPGARILSIKVLDSNNRFCCSSDVVAGLDFIIANRPDVRVVNMSLGTFATFEGECDDATAFTLLFADAIDTLTEDGVAVFAASGNTSVSDRMKAPGCVANAISVGAVDDADRVASFSGGGETLDLLAPGVAIRAANRGGGTRTLSGTSMSTPHAAGVAALLLEAHPLLSPARLLEALAGTGVPVTDWRSGLAHPRIDAEAALLNLVEVCDDGADNDGDDLVDVEDPDCPPVEIDVEPARSENLIRLSQGAVVSVAILGSEDLDALDVDPASLAFGPGQAAPTHDLTRPGEQPRHHRDVNDDGLLDLVTHYPVSEAGIGPEDVEACLSGTIGAEVFRACDEVVPMCNAASASRRRRLTPKTLVPCRDQP